MAANMKAEFGGPPFERALIWQAEIERHFLLIAARNLIRAIDDLGTLQIPIEPTLSAELVDGRNLHEHWDENMPIFNVTPRPAEPTHGSGKNFAKRNPDRSPFSRLNWNSTEGAMVLPKVPASVMYEIVDRVEEAVTEKDATLRRFILDPAPSPWLGETHGSDRWWPR